MNSSTTHQNDSQATTPGNLVEELARAREALDACRKLSEFSAGALRAITDGVITVDLHGTISFLNPVASHMIGWPEKEALGRPVTDILMLYDDHGTRIDVLAPTGTISSLRRRDRHVVFVQGAVTPLVEDDEDAIGCVVTFRNVTATRRLTDELKYQATHDSLTGLHNRRAFESKLQRAIASARQQQACHSIICIDLDRFKAVNDRGGHVAGDELLRQLSVLLREQLREHDTLARLGGDEFAVLLEHCQPGQATVVAEKIRCGLEGFRFQWQGQEFTIGASMGQVNFHDDAATGVELLNVADEMCYVAKRRGRNQVVVHPRYSHGSDAGVDEGTSSRRQSSQGR
jgi:diguanylate cyclase (GGDEF)-like protein/PAS domain S-box-containing protein